MVARTAWSGWINLPLQLLSLGSILPTYQRGRLCEIGKFGDCHHPKDSGPAFRRQFGMRCHFRICEGFRTCRDSLTLSALRRILLQKSFWGGERKFLEPLMRFTRGDVRDHIDLRGGVEKRRSSREVQRSTFARF